MPREKKTTWCKVEARLAPSLRDKFARHCKKLNVSMAQRTRDLIQQALKK